MIARDAASLAALLDAIAAELESAPTRAQERALADVHAQGIDRYPYQCGALEHATRSGATAIRAAIRRHLTKTSKRKAA